MSIIKNQGRMFDDLPYHKLPNLETINKHYFDEEMSPRQIGRLYGASETAVRLRLTRNGIKTRSMKEAWQLLGNHIKITPELTSELDGLLLGDGCLVPHYEVSANYSHSDKNPEYIIWLKNQLETHSMISRIEKPNPYVNKSSLASKSYRELYDYRIRWYPDGNKIIPDDLILKPITLRNWYIGDGSFYPGRNRTKKGQLVTIGCIKLDPKPLISQFKEQGIDTTIYPTRIYIPASSRPAFFKYILSDKPEIPACYRYKFPEHYLEMMK